MFNEREYLQILDLYFDMGESLKGEVPEDPRILDAQALAVKLLFHAASAFWLYKGTRVPGMRRLAPYFFDHASARVLVRAAFESLLAFHYIFVDSKTDDDFEFRYNAWKLSGLAIREGFPAQMPEYQEQLRQEKQFNDSLREKIRETKQFQKLKHGVQRDILKGKKWRLKGIKEMARSAGIGRAYSGSVYSYLSGYVHSDSLSALQVSQAKAREDQLMLLTGALVYMCIILSKMILFYSEKFPRAAKVLKEHP